jgi:hypothetical protein
MRRLVVLGIAAVVTGLIVGVVVANSGDDGGGGDSSGSVPELTPLPGSADPGTRTRERTDTDETTTEDSGGTPAPAEPPATGGSGGTTGPQDSPQNDTPPPSGSPAERFEQFCQENPGAC